MKSNHDKSEKKSLKQEESVCIRKKTVNVTYDQMKEESIQVKGINQH